MLICKTFSEPSVVYMDAEYRKSKLRTSKCDVQCGADLCPVGGVVAGAALVQGAAVQEGEHAAPRRRAAANHSSASPSSQSQLTWPSPGWTRSIAPSPPARGPAGEMRHPGNLALPSSN